MTFEGQQMQGSIKIMEKVGSLTFQKIQRSVTAVDCQPTFDGGILINVLGQLKVSQEATGLDMCLGVMWNLGGDNVCLWSVGKNLIKVSLSFNNISRWILEDKCCHTGIHHCIRIYCFKISLLTKCYPTTVNIVSAVIW